MKIKQVKIAETEPPILVINCLGIDQLVWFGNQMKKLAIKIDTDTSAAIAS